MAKVFNVTGPCIPKKHYMVDLCRRLEEIKKLVDAGEYFTINRARQYGKTTTLMALADFLKKDYTVLFLDFQMLDNEDFSNAAAFSKAFVWYLLKKIRNRKEPVEGLSAEVEEEMEHAVKNSGDFSLRELFGYLSDLCDTAQKPVVLMIDEVDSATNNQVFLDFLAQLRAYYLARKSVPTFQSVILAGVYDVKNIRRRIRSDEEHRGNSPWNIAADFTVSMSFTKEEISRMLKDYEADYQTGMDIPEMAELLYAYTSGYPYLVSRLCKLIDERIGGEKEGAKKAAWTEEGFLKAVRMLLIDTNTLFESLIGKLADYPELERMLKELLFLGKPISYNPTNPVISLAVMFGFVKNVDGKVVPANRIFDTLLYNHFLSMDELQSSGMYTASLLDKNMFIQDGHLDMRKILERFVLHFHDLYGNQKETFLEEEGRRYFLLYLRPIINGIGNYYIESRTRSLGRTDIIVDYRGEQFVVETKIWRGNEYNTRGERQIMGYLEDYGLQTGYMLSFCFNQKKQIGVKELEVDGKRLIEAVV